MYCIRDYTTIHIHIYIYKLMLLLFLSIYIFIYMFSPRHSTFSDIIEKFEQFVLLLKTTLLFEFNS